MSLTQAEAKVLSGVGSRCLGWSRVNLHVDEQRHANFGVVAARSGQGGGTRNLALVFLRGMVMR